MGFWSRLEDQILRLQRDRLQMARYLRIAWWISNAFLLIGVLVALAIFTGYWSP